MRKNSAILVIISTMIIVSLLWATLLFFADFACNATLMEIARHPTVDSSDAANGISIGGNSVTIQTPWLMEEERKNDQNFKNPNWKVYLNTENILQQSFGIVNSLMSLSDGDYEGYSKLNKNLGVSSQYNHKTGQIAFYDVVKDKKKWDRNTDRFYAGPKGVSEEPTENIGRFIDPIFSSSNVIHVYDKELRQFFMIEFQAKPITDETENTIEYKLEQKRFVKSEPLPEDGSHKPIRIATYGFNHGEANGCVSAGWDEPENRVEIKSKPEDDRIRWEWENIDIDISHGSGKYLLVLNDSGRIDLWDRETLKFERTAGRLPTPRTFFGKKTLSEPKNLAGYAIVPLQKKSKDGPQYMGLCVAAARDGWGLTVQLFDPNGARQKNIANEWTRSRRNKTYKSYTAYSSTPGNKRIFSKAGGPLVFTIRYILENLQPPIFSLASFFTSDFIQAESSFRAIFLRPNSLVGTMGQRITKDPYSKFFAALMLMMPSILLALFLGRCIWIQSRLLGSAQKNRIIWFWATVAFGIPAFITFKLTRPKETPVTCFQCGKLRRPADPQCHWCNADWDTTAQSPPAWRILDKPNIQTEETKEDTKPDPPTEDQGSHQDQT